MGMGRLYRVVAAAAVLAALPVQAQNPVFSSVVQARYVHCAFYKAYDVDRVTGDNVLVEGRSETLTHFQGIDGTRARQITTRTAGAHEVRVAHTGKYLHFIERVAGMYVLTTIYDCIDHDRHGTCVTYGATQSRHFDARVLSDPDSVYEALRDSSDPGFCDHSFTAVQEATR